MGTALEKRDKPDGRRQRAELSREAIVDAILSLLSEGVLRPGAQQIAARAGVSMRSVFRHFEDLDGLFAAAVERQRELIRPLFELAPQGESLQERVDVLVAQRARLYEEISPTRQAAVRQAPFHTPLRRGLEEAAVTQRRQIAEIFRDDLATLPAAERRELAEAVEAASSWSFWDNLRREQGLSADRARRIMTRAIAALFAAARRS